MAHEVVRPGGLKGVLFKANAPTKDGSNTSVVTRPDATPSPTPVNPDRPPKKRGIGRKIGKIAGYGLAVLTATEVVGAVYTEYTNNVPLSADIPTLIQDFAWPKTLLDNTLFKEKALPAFDPAANSAVVEAGANTVYAPTDTLKRAYEEQADGNKGSKNPTVLFPVQFTQNGQRAGYRYAKPSSPFTDGTVIEFPGSISLKLDKGAEILVMAENAEVFQYKPAIIGGKEYFVGLWIKFQQNGEIYGFGISSADVRTFIPSQEIAGAPIVPNREQGGLDLSGAKNGLKLPLGTPVARINYITNVTDMNAGMNFKRYNRETGRWEEIRPNFVTDNSSGQVKLLVSSSQR